MTSTTTFLLGALWGMALVVWGNQVTLPEWAGRLGRWARWPR